MRRRWSDLVEPKNALTKQYKKLFEMEDVGLTFDPESPRAVAQRALKRGTGAAVSVHSRDMMTISCSTCPTGRTCARS